MGFKVQGLGLSQGLTHASARCLDRELIFRVCVELLQGKPRELEVQVWSSCCPLIISGFGLASCCCARLELGFHEVFGSGAFQVGGMLV